MMTGAMIEGILAVIGAATCLYWTFRALAAFLRWIQPPGEATTATPAVTSAGTVAPSDIPWDDVVVIAAAVNVMMTGHRIVHIQDSRSGAAWSSEGRWMHQTSHNPH